MDATQPAKRHRLRRFLRIGGGWALIVLGTVVMLSAPDTKTQPTSSCGKPALIVMFDRGAARSPLN